MDAKTLTALKGSIAKWEAIVAGTGEDRGAANCPLCAVFHHSLRSSCEGCPVERSTGQYGCLGSPYEHFTDAFTTPINDLREADRSEATCLAQDELDFLRSLLPTAP